MLATTEIFRKWHRKGTQKCLMEQNTEPFHHHIWLPQELQQYSKYSSSHRATITTNAAMKINSTAVLGAASLAAVSGQELIVHTRKDVDPDPIPEKIHENANTPSTTFVSKNIQQTLV
jgi:hypothetical protein